MSEASKNAIAKSWPVDYEELAHAGFQSRYLDISRRLVVTAERLDEVYHHWSDPPPSTEVCADLDPYEVVAAKYVTDAICSALTAGLRPERVATIAANLTAFALEHEHTVVFPLEPKGMDILVMPRVQHVWRHSKCDVVLVVSPLEGVQFMWGDVEEAGDLDGED